MSTNVPHVPLEIVLAILSSPALEFPDILKCTQVSKEWHGLIYSTNKLRAKLFLPLQTASSSLQEASPREWEATVYASVEILGESFLRDALRYGYKRLHPLIRPHHTVAHYPGISRRFCFNNQLMRRLHDLHQKGSTSWTAALLSSPPINHLVLGVWQIECGSKARITRRDYTIKNKYGITMGDLFSVMEGTRLKSNMAIIDDNGICMRTSKSCTGELEPCVCHDAIGRYWQS